jgi:hypothetical protein
MSNLILYLGNIPIMNNVNTASEIPPQKKSYALKPDDLLRPWHIPIPRDYMVWKQNLETSLFYQYELSPNHAGTISVLDFDGHSITRVTKFANRSNLR